MIARLRWVINSQHESGFTGVVIVSGGKLIYLKSFVVCNDDEQHSDSGLQLHSFYQKL